MVLNATPTPVHDDVQFLLAAPSYEWMQFDSFASRLTIFPTAPRSPVRWPHNRCSKRQSGTEKTASRGYKISPHFAGCYVDDRRGLQSVVDRHEGLASRTSSCPAVTARNQRASSNPPMNCLSTWQTLGHPVKDIGTTGYAEAHYSAPNETHRGDVEEEAIPYIHGHTGLLRPAGRSGLDRTGPGPWCDMPFKIGILRGPQQYRLLLKMSQEIEGGD